jgi:riboflavin kinase / FMN adenylyltransferase
MNIFNDISHIDKDSSTIITVGTFDGLHVGHRNIMEKVVEEAQSKNGRSIVITFEPHPRSVVSKDFEVKLLTTLDEKIDLIDKAGIENLLIINFTKEFSQLSAEQFIKNHIVEKIGVKELVIGHDHHFGKDRFGDENKLKELGNIYSFDVLSVNAVSINNEIVNSTTIRHALELGNLEKANMFLGRSYSLSGIVITGSKRGRNMGFPTANIDLKDKQKLIPANGIYIVEFFVNAIRYFGLMNIGTRPTFEDSNKIIIEVYLLNFNNDIYGKEVTVNILKRMRDEIKYPSKEELIKQMEIDKINGIKIIESLIN